MAGRPRRTMQRDNLRDEDITLCLEDSDYENDDVADPTFQIDGRNNNRQDYSDDSSSSSSDEANTMPQDLDQDVDQPSPSSSNSRRVSRGRVRGSSRRGTRRNYRTPVAVRETIAHTANNWSIGNMNVSHSALMQPAYLPTELYSEEDKFKYVFDYIGEE